MTAEELNKLMEHVKDPVYKIEADLKMPKTTLQKALKGQRELSVKWERVLQEKYYRPSEDEMMSLPINFHRDEKEYFALIRQFVDRKSLLILKHEVENSRVLSEPSKRTQLSNISFKLQRTKY